MAERNLLKRKGSVDEVSDDFSDFSLSSPATKIRRLDAALPPIVEEEEPLSLPPNNERALVLFKPPRPSPFSLTFASDLISGIKNQQLAWSKQCDFDCDHLIEEEQDENNHRLALVPWVPSQSTTTLGDSDNINTELMEADEMRGGDGDGDGDGDGEAAMMMDIEQEGGTASNSSTSTIHYPTTLNLQQHQGIAGVAPTVPEGFQQHCLWSQPPQNTSTPITWTRS